MTVELFNLLCQVDEQVYLIYKDEIQNQTKNVSEYLALVSELLPHIAEMCPDKILNSGTVDYWLELCAREAEKDGKHGDNLNERILALSLLSEIWYLFTEYVDSKEEMASTLLFMLKRAIRERAKSIRIASVAYLFKLLDKLSSTKNKSAPLIYKTLIFSLIENPNDPTIREMYFSNFKELFQSNSTIPIGLLADPLVKQIQTSLGISFALKIFDFDFFIFIIDHPKL